MKRNIALPLVLSALSLAATNAWSAVDHYYWADAEANVTITYPDQVAYNAPFSVSFNVDSTGSTAGTLAFLSVLTMTDTAVAGGGTWEWELNSLNPPTNGTANGSLGDSNAPYTHTPGTSYEFNLADPAYTGTDYTWLFTDFDEQVTWTLNFPAILADTGFNLLLDSTVGWGYKTEMNFVVSQVPLPAAYLLYLSGAGLLLLAGKRKRAA